MQGNEEKYYGDMEVQVSKIIKTLKVRKSIIAYGKKNKKN
jgi:hypothetical protein